jgi:hypothetical protein
VAIFWPPICTLSIVMETIAQITSLPDTTALILMGLVLIATASILKKRLVSSHVGPSTDQEHTTESRSAGIQREQLGYLDSLRSSSSPRN